MLASLTGLLLNLGGDQPAVVFDPPLDPAIFDWDGTTLKVREEFMPLELSFPDPLPPYVINQKMIINKRVTFIRQITGFDFASGSPELVRSRISIFDYYADSDGWEDISIQSGDTCEAGSVFIVAEIKARTGSREVFTVEIDGGDETVGDLSSRVASLEEKVQALEQALESCQCASDLDGDGAVGFNDLVQLISDWGPCSA